MRQTISPKPRNCTSTRVTPVRFFSHIRMHLTCSNWRTPLGSDVRIRVGAEAVKVALMARTLSSLSGSSGNGKSAL